VDDPAIKIHEYLTPSDDFRQKLRHGTLLLKKDRALKKTIDKKGEGSKSYSPSFFLPFLSEAFYSREANIPIR
jgi:hypothetical protein